MDAHLNETGIEQDATGKRVEHTADDACGRASRVVCLPDAEPCRDAYRSGDAVQDRADDGDVVVLGRQTKEGEPGANTETLESFCEDVTSGPGTKTDQLGGTYDGRR